MSALPIRSISVRLDRNVAPAAGEAFSGVPLTVVGTLPSGLTFEGVTQVYAELHNAAGLIAADDGLEELPTDESSVSLTFSGQKMQQAAGKYSISIYAVYPEERIEILRVAEVHLYDGLASGRQLVYWGTSAATSLDADGVLALGNSSLNTSRAQSFIVDGNDEHIYFVCPAAYGPPSFTVFGLPTAGWIEGDVSMRKENGDLTPYKSYRTPAPQAGNDIEIKVS